MTTSATHFVIEDETHCEQIGDFHSLDEVRSELKRIASVPWGTEPNKAPCGSGDRCERRYVLIVGNYLDGVWNQTSRTSIFHINANELAWDDLGFMEYTPTQKSSWCVG
jgi:hypothetical protein